MGFSKAQAIDVVRIKLVYPVNDAKTGETVQATVTHILRVPTTEEREEYNRRIVKTKGRKVVSDTSVAAWYLWTRCIESVEGYDDIPADGNFRLYFKEDDTVGIHIDNAISSLMEFINADEVETEKK